MDLEHTSNQSDIFDPSTPKTSNRGSPPNEPVAAPYATDDDSIDERSICPKCRQVDWDSLPTLDERLKNEDMGAIGRTLRTIEANHEQLATSSCKICRILSVVKSQSLDNTECYVAAGPLLYRRAYALPSRCDITALYVCPNNRYAQLEEHGPKCLVAIRRDAEDLISRMISPRSIDYDWLKSLAQSCEESHKECCRRGSLGSVSVPGLKVIEVSSRTIIEAPAGCRYVALSYVWGEQPDIDLASHLQYPPRLIQDAISVTIAMGYEYLWIDRYCIRQTDDQERYDMINQMDQVYLYASLTIIDACGGDSQGGLSGVSNVTRRPQECVHIRNTSVFELPCGEHELNSSKWATRGWTYQEGYFASRRLIFTPSQVLFLCNQHYEEESVYRLLQQNNPEYSGSMGNFWHLTPSFSIGEMVSFHLETHLREYSKRELTYPRDSLNAFLGVLNSYTRESRIPTSSIMHVSWGLVAERIWKTGDLCVNLNWIHEAPAERRPEFPSWAWSGWGGPLRFGRGITLHKLVDDSRPLRHLEWEISWDSKNDKAVNIWEFANEYSSVPYTDKLQLHRHPIHQSRLKVTCLVVPISSQMVPLMGAQKKTSIHFENETGEVRVKWLGVPEKMVTVVQFCQGIYIAAPTFLDQELDMRDRIIGLLFARDDDRGINFGCLLARQLKDGTYERVGDIPHLMAYPLYKFRHENPCLPGLVFLDEAGSILEKVRVTARQMELPFDGVSERRTIILV